MKGITGELTDVLDICELILYRMEAHAQDIERIGQCHTALGGAIASLMKVREDVSKLESRVSAAEAAPII